MPRFEPFYEATYARLEEELGDGSAGKFAEGRRATAELPLAELARV